MPLAEVPITGRKIRFALVGCGRISGKHVEALEAHKDSAELVAGGGAWEVRSVGMIG